MYYSFFTAYIIVGMALSVPVLYWAVKNGQFRDQQRARYLPLEEKPEGRASRAAKAPRYELYALGILASAGLLTSGVVLLFTLV